MCIIKADVKSWQIIAYRKRVPDMRKKWIRLIAAAMGSFLLAGCGADTQIDDYATNAGAESVQQMIELLHGLGALHNDTDKCNSCLHIFS